MDDSNLGYEHHGFADASESAYAAVLYLWILNDVDQVQISILISKTKAAPVKDFQFPVGALCCSSVIATCPIRASFAESHDYTDSFVN